MMPPMPRIETQRPIQRNNPEFGMPKSAFPVFRLERTKEGHPAAVQSLQQVERNLRRRAQRVLRQPLEIGITRIVHEHAADEAAHVEVLKGALGEHAVKKPTFDFTAKGAFGCERI